MSLKENKAFRVALLDTTRTTADIAATYKVSVQYCREMRKQYGRPYANRLPLGMVSSGGWQKYPDWVSDVYKLRHKELRAKYGWSETSISVMRKQLGVVPRHITKSKEFKAAIKTRLAKEVAAIYGVSLAAIAIARRKAKVVRAYGKYERLKDKKFARDVATLSSRQVSEKYGISKANVFYYRKGLATHEHPQSGSPAQADRRMPGRRPLDD